MGNTTSKWDIKNRLIDFGVFVTEIFDSLLISRSGYHVSGQVLSYCNSPEFNYGESTDAESKIDSIYKVKFILIELRETFIGLKIINRTKLYKKKT